MMSEMSATTVTKQQKSQKIFKRQRLGIRFLTENVNKNLYLKPIYNNEKICSHIKNYKNSYISLFHHHLHFMTNIQRNREYTKNKSCCYYLCIKMVT